MWHSFYEILPPLGSNLLTTGKSCLQTDDMSVSRQKKTRPCRPGSDHAIASMRSLSAGLALLISGPASASGTWDCRPADDNSGWACSQDGVPFTPEQPADTAPGSGVREAPAHDTKAQTVRAAPAKPTDSSMKPPAEPPKPVRREVPAEFAVSAPPKAVAAPESSAAPGQAAATRPATAPAAHVEPGISDSRDQKPDSAALPVASERSAPRTPQPVADESLSWRSCRPVPGVATLFDSQSQSQLPIDITADSLELDNAGQMVLLQGEVLVEQGDQRITADNVRYDRDAAVLDATGHVTLSRPDIRITGERVNYNLTQGTGKAEDAHYELPGLRARGTAASAELASAAQATFDRITYTTCQPGNSDWLLEAAALDLDRAAGVGTATDAKLSFLGAPLLYLPTMTFPIDDRRKSGLLVPSVGYSSGNGFDLAVPYYVNLAENYDLTLTPRALAKRGLMLDGQFRFLTEIMSGQIDVDILPHDNEAPQHDPRGSASIEAEAQLSARLEGSLQAGYVSDDDYLQDFGGSLAVSATQHVERTAELLYHADFWDVGTRAQYYQTIDPALTLADRPYHRLPQVFFNLEQPVADTPLTYHLDSEFVRFEKPGATEGTRVDLQPAISASFGNGWSYVTPRVAARYTSYDLDDQTPGLDDSPDRLTGSFSLDSGLFFDRSTNWFGSAVTHTLEPRMFYLLTSRTSQTDIPIFDTTELDFTFDNLFRDNAFNGADRQSDANQLTLAVTSRLLDDASGAELLRASLGQILYFRDRTVTLPGVAAGRDDTSALVAELAAELGAGWRTRGGVQWNPHDGDNGTIDQALAQLNYRDGNERVFNAAYRLRDGITSQTDLAAIWPVGEYTSLIGRWNYSLSEDRNQETLAGIEYGKCCWRIRAVIRRFSNRTDDSQNTAFLLQLELNGLGRLGDNIDDFLERGIYGYRQDND